MKALVIDCAVSKLSLAAKNEDKVCVTSYDIGMKQSEILVSAIDYVLSSVELKTNELDYTAITIGPGSFTGLRLGISALKALECAFKIPVYGISSLQAYNQPFLNLYENVLSCIDGNKDKFYVNIRSKNQEFLKDGDYDLESIIANINNFSTLLLSGPDNKKLYELVKDRVKTNLIIPDFQVITSEALFQIAEDMIAKKMPSLNEYDGPIYLRASEAEIKLSENK